MKNIKSNKRVIKWLIAIIVILLLALGYVLFGNKVLNRKASDNDTTITTTKINDDKVYKNIDEFMISNNIDYKALQSLEKLFALGDYERDIYQWNDVIYRYGKFQYNNKTIYVDYNDSKSLSFSVPKERDYTDRIKEYISVYVYNNYYILVDSSGFDDGKFKIYDFDLNELLSDTYESEFVLADQDIFYTTYDCKYTDDNHVKKGVNNFNLVSKDNKLTFYVEHNAGWKC